MKNRNGGNVMRHILKIIVTIILVLIGFNIALHLIGKLFSVIIPIVILAAICFGLYRIWYHQNNRRHSDQFFD
ncbi:hypothetical protein HMPREF0556_11272 [Listeria grayi DSM 20601]|uniref:Uncharacterized protein n=1 Tax=Listeria grayi DSM 20601 TaxID=525367 RepID=D7UVN8_LISGR|nr:hypothetical protein HMPREF0556_11272 [Listeria grayi DSM 20601]